MYGKATKAQNVCFIFNNEIQDLISVFGSLINHVKCKLCTLYQPRMILNYTLQNVKTMKFP